MKNFLRNNIIAVILVVVLAGRMLVNYGFFENPLAALKQWAISMLLVLPGIIIGITIHEFAHAFAAYKLGDMTPKRQKRVSLNPIRHIDPIGFVALLLIGFGWGKPVQVNPYAFKHPRRDNLITDVAGIAMNFVLAFIFAGLTFLFVSTAGASITGITGADSISDFLSQAAWLPATGGNTFVYYATLVLYYIIWMNLVLMIFNLIPVPPLDGFGIVTEIFKLREKPIYQQLYQAGFPILMLLIILNIPSKIIAPIINFIFRFLEGIFF